MSNFESPIIKNNEPEKTDFPIAEEILRRSKEEEETKRLFNEISDVLYEDHPDMAISNMAEKLISGAKSEGLSDAEKSQLISLFYDEMQNLSAKDVMERLKEISEMTAKELLSDYNSKKEKVAA